MSIDLYQYRIIYMKYTNEKILSHEWCLRLLVTTLLLLTIILFILFVWVCITYTKYTISIVFGYLFILEIFIKINRIIRNTIINKLTTILVRIVQIINSLLLILSPFYKIFKVFFISLISSFIIPCTLYFIVIEFLKMHVPWNFFIMCSLAFISISFVYYNNWTLNLAKLTSMSLHDENNNDSLQMQFIKYVLSSKNINFIIYLAYLVFIIIANYIDLSVYKNRQNVLHLLPSEVIRNAFLVHIAFSNLVTKKQEADFDKEVITQYLLAVLSKICHK